MPRMPNAVAFFEIGCRESAETIAFYQSLFDWNLMPMPSGAFINTASGIQGQINSLGHEPHQYTLFYVHVDDIEASIEKTKSLGGSLVVGPITIPTGKFAWIKDPGGNMVGICTQEGRE